MTFRPPSVSATSRARADVGVHSSNRASAKAMTSCGAPGSGAGRPSSRYRVAATARPSTAKIRHSARMDFGRATTMGRSAPISKSPAMIVLAQLRSDANVMTSPANALRSSSGRTNSNVSAGRFKPGTSERLRTAASLLTRCSPQRSNDAETVKSASLKKAPGRHRPDRTTFLMNRPDPYASTGPSCEKSGSSSEKGTTLTPWH